MAKHRQGRITAILTLASLLTLSLAQSGCSKVECGKGTVEVDGVCEVANALVCTVGFKPLGNKCVPEAEWIKYKCGENTEYDPVTDTCKGTGGGTVVEDGGVKPVSCPACPAPSGSAICLQGRVFHAPELMAKWAGDDAYKSPTPLASKDGAVVKVYDPIAFVSNPATSQPLATSGIDDDGCWKVDSVDIPFTSLFAIAIDDVGSSVDEWALAGLGETPTPGKNSTNLDIPAVSQKVAKDWGNNLLADGLMVMLFRDLNGKGVEGVVPTFDGKPPVNGKFDGTSMEVYFVAEDPTQTTTAVDASATKTTKSGAVFVKKAEVKAFTGTKSGCSIETGLGGSTPDVIFFRVFDVSGC